MASTVERALELARSGACRNITEIRRALTRERCESVDLHLGGRALQDQLKAAMKTRSA